MFAEIFSNRNLSTPITNTNPSSSNTAPIEPNHHVQTSRVHGNLTVVFH